MAIERVMGIHRAPLSAVSTQEGNSAASTSASGETSRDKTQARVEDSALSSSRQPSATASMRPYSRQWCMWNPAAIPRPSPRQERRA